jgi:hypothetical protein
MGAVFLVILVLFLLGAMPNYSYSRNWGYAPSGAIGFLLIILVVLMLVGQVPWWGYGPGPTVYP